MKHKVLYERDCFTCKRGKTKYVSQGETKVLLTQQLSSLFGDWWHVFFLRFRSVTAIDTLGSPHFRATCFPAFCHHYHLHNYSSTFIPPSHFVESTDFWKMPRSAHTLRTPNFRDRSVKTQTPISVQLFGKTTAKWFLFVFKMAASQPPLFYQLSVVLLNWGTVRFMRKCLFSNLSAAGLQHC